MKFKLFFIYLLIICLGFASYNWTYPKDPVGESTVVGALLIEINGTYPLTPETIVQELDIAITCEYMDEQGAKKFHRFYTKTDKAGYFKLENVPAGKYILKAVEMDVGPGINLTAVSKYGLWTKGERYRYWGMIIGMMYENVTHLMLDEFDVEKRQGLIDLGIIYLEIKLNYYNQGYPLTNWSPTNQPPWQRMTVFDRGAILEFIMVEYETFSELMDRELGGNKKKYNRKSPSQYFNLKES